ncbi:hypothetical protein [Bogoriella caseilytica]|uniref:hypothetical protein n=1 Tax=Bogoriella caseilytica TaxID=56055 RepID=UPI0011CE2770|nr:hypothetical protein [Bogoriella caseilytica]
MTQHPEARRPTADQPPTPGAPRWVLAAVVLLALSSWYALRGIFFSVERVVTPLAQGVVEHTAVLDLFSGLTVAAMPGTAALLAGAAMMGSPLFARIAGMIGLAQTAGALIVLTLMAVSGAGVFVVSGAAAAILLLPVAAMVLIQGLSDDAAPPSGAPVAVASLAALSALTFGVAPVVIMLADSMLFSPVRDVLAALVFSALATSLPVVAACMVASKARSARWASAVIAGACALLAAVNALTVVATLGAMSHTPSTYDVTFMVLTPVTLGAAAVCAVFAARSRQDPQTVATTSD